MGDRMLGHPPEVSKLSLLLAPVSFRFGAVDQV